MLGFQNSSATRPSTSGLVWQSSLGRRSALPQVDGENLNTSFLLIISNEQLQGRYDQGALLKNPTKSSLNSSRSTDEGMSCK